MASLKLIAVGDICLQTKNDEDPFKNVKEIFMEKDILFGNLETVLSSYGQEAKKAVLLHTVPDKVHYLKDAGFDILNIANNHIMDLGLNGFNETIDVLNQNDLPFIGACNKKFNQPFTIIRRKEASFGFLGYDESGFRDPDEEIFINKIDENVIVADIKDLKSKCDIIIVSLHWGTENVFYPSPEQIALARNLIDSGADLILGHHPHVVQGIEKYKNGLIAYSLGNFQFQADRERTTNSIILVVEVGKEGVEDYNIVPVRIDHNYISVLMDDVEKKKMLSFIEAVSEPIIKGRVNEKWWFEEIAYEHLHGNMKAWIIRIKKYGIKHFLRCIKWLVSPFTIKCYLGFLRRKLRKC